MEPQFYSTYILIGAIVIVSLIGFNNRNFMENYLFSPYLVKYDREFYRFITHPFLHQDFAHLIFNSITLYYFGRFFESKMHSFYGPMIGETVFWFFIITSMFASSSVAYFRHRDNPNYRSLGFSGVGCAVLFASIMLEPSMQVGLIILPVMVPAWIFGLLYLGFEIYSDRNRRTNIAHDAHISGAVFGIIFILITNIGHVIQAFQNLL